jgi:hypothetical protein
LAQTLSDALDQARQVVFTHLVATHHQLHDRILQQILHTGFTVPAGNSAQTVTAEYLTNCLDHGSSLPANPTVIALKRRAHLRHDICCSAQDMFFLIAFKSKIRERTVTTLANRKGANVCPGRRQAILFRSPTGELRRGIRISTTP